MTSNFRDSTVYEKCLKLSPIRFPRMLYSLNGGRKFCRVCTFAQARLSLNKCDKRTISLLRFSHVMYDALATTFFCIRGAVQNSLESVHLLRLDHESFSLTKTHITHSISAYVSFIYRMAVESSGFLASNIPGYHVERSCTFE